MTKAIQKREKILLGGFETWIEYNVAQCCIILFGFETAKHGLVLNVMGIDGHKYVNGFIEIGARLTEQERTELKNYLNNDKR